jgi:hypothetical protein
MNKQFILDRAGFPMVWVEPLDGYLHWLPVTKIQFEFFITDRPSPTFNEQWYLDILALNERVSPRAVRKNNYWQMFISGIKPEEANAYAEWCGEDFGFPTIDEWNQTYQYLNAESADASFWDDLENIKLMPETVLKAMEKINQDLYPRGAERTLAAQMFMRYGVMEWVQTDLRGQEWGGIGQSNSGLQPVIRPPEQGQAEFPKDPEGMRLHYYGFRLLRR